MRLDARPSELTCVYCKAPDAGTTCDGCAAVYHDDCLRDDLQGACATLGCDQVEAPVEEETWTPPRVPGRHTGWLALLAVLLGVIAIATASFLPSGTTLQAILAWTGAIAAGPGLLILSSSLKAADPPRPQATILHRAPIY